MPIDLEIQKEAAKIGMTATLGATVVTSMFMKNKVAKKEANIAHQALEILGSRKPILSDTTKKRK